MSTKYEFRFFPSGFAWKEVGYLITCYKSYENIKCIRVDKNRILYVECEGESSSIIDISAEEEEDNRDEIFFNIQNHWFEYLENPNSRMEQFIDKKIEEFLDRFELSPGGSQYELAKERQDALGLFKKSE
jgi:hypothetical protein